MRQLRNTAGFRIVRSNQFPMQLGPSYARSQLAYASQQASRLSDSRLRAAFLERAAALQAEAARLWETRGRNYAIVARREK